MMQLVPNFWRSWSWLVAAIGVALPEIFQLLADNTALLPFLPVEWQGPIRLIALVGVLILRPIRQRNMEA